MNAFRKPKRLLGSDPNGQMRFGVGAGDGVEVFPRAAIEEVVYLPWRGTEEESAIEVNSNRLVGGVGKRIA